MREQIKRRHVRSLLAVAVASLGCTLAARAGGSADVITRCMQTGSHCLILVPCVNFPALLPQNPPDVKSGKDVVAGEMMTYCAFVASTTELGCTESEVYPERMCGLQYLYTEPHCIGDHAYEMDLYYPIATTPSTMCPGS